LLRFDRNEDDSRLVAKRVLRCYAAMIIGVVLSLIVLFWRNVQK